MERSTGRVSTTIVDVARRAGVSKSTVSNVVRGRAVTPELRNRVLEAIAELGYAPSAVAQGLAGRRTQTLGVMVPRLENPFYAEMLSGIEEAAEQDGHQLLVASTDTTGRTEAQAANSLRSYRPAGYLLCGMRDLTVAANLAGRGVPIVVLDSHDAPETAGRVVVDDYVGMRLAVNHLVALGHRRIAAVIASDVDAGRHRRLTGYVDALEAAGLDAADELRLPDLRSPGASEPASRPVVVDRLLHLDPRPTAVVAGDDLTAIGLIDTIEARGLLVPQDISVVGFDDIAWARVGRIALTTVRQPARAIGAEGTVALIDHLLGRTARPLSEFRQLVEPELVIRGTTGPPP